MEYPGLLNFANSVRLTMASDPGRQFFKDQVQTHGFSFLDEYLQNITSVQKQDHLIELVKTPSRKKVASKVFKLMDPIPQLATFAPSFPEPMPLWKSTKPRDPSMNTVLLGAATPGAPVDGQRTSWLMKAREMRKKSQTPGMGSGVGSSSSLAFQGTKRKSDPFSLPQVGIRDDGRPPKLAKTSVDEGQNHPPPILESAEEDVLDRLKKTVEGLGVHVGKGKSVGSDTAIVLAEARAAAEARVAERGRMKEELIMAMPIPETVEHKTVENEARVTEQEEELTMAMPVPETVEHKTVENEAQVTEQEEELTMAMTGPKTAKHKPVENEVKGTEQEELIMATTRPETAKHKPVENEAKDTEQEELIMATTGFETAKHKPVEHEARATEQEEGFTTPPETPEHRMEHKIAENEVIRDDKEPPKVAKTSVDESQSQPTTISTVDSGQEGILNRLKKTVEDLGVHVGKMAGKSVKSDITTVLAEAKIAEQDLMEEELTLAMPAPETVEHKTVENKLIRDDEQPPQVAQNPSRLLNSSTLETSKKGKQPGVEKVLQMAAIAAKKQQEEADKKAARLKEMESRRQLAIQRKAEEEERKLKEEADRWRREREELTDKKPIKFAGNKKEESLKKRKIEVEKKQEIKKPSSSVLANKTHFKFASSYLYGGSSQPAPAESSFSNHKEKRIQNPVVDDEVSQPSMLVQSQMAARVKAQMDTVKRVEPAIPSESIELPEINSEYSDSEDEDRVRTFDPPEWAQSPELRQALEVQSTINPDDIFGAVRPLKMEEIFKTRTSRFRARTSSANWTGIDGLTVQEEREYARRMGFK